MKPGSKIIAALGGAAAVLVLSIVPFFEGTVYEGYLDPVGIVTACNGHTATAELGRDYTPAECQQLLEADILEHARIVDRCVKVPLAPHERAAYTDFALNVGPGKPGVKDGFCVLKSGRTPTFLQRLNAGDRAGACRGLNENGSWTRAAGKPLPGLVKRRAAERALCEGQPEAIKRWGGP